MPRSGEQEIKRALGPKIDTIADSIKSARRNVALIRALPRDCVFPDPGSPAKTISVRHDVSYPCPTTAATIGSHSRDAGALPSVELGELDYPVSAIRAGSAHASAGFPSAVRLPQEDGQAVDYHPGAPDDLSLAPVTQAWLAVSDDFPL